MIIKKPVAKKKKVSVVAKQPKGKLVAFSSLQKKQLENLMAEIKSRDFVTQKEIFNFIPSTKRQPNVFLVLNTNLMFLISSY